MAKKDYFDNVMSSRFVTNRIVFRILGDGDEIRVVEKNYREEISLNKGKVGRRTKIDGVSYSIADVFEEENALVMILEDPEKFEARRALELEEEKAAAKAENEEIPAESPAKEKKEWEDDDTDDVGISCETEEVSEADLDSQPFEMS